VPSLPHTSIMTLLYLVGNSPSPPVPISPPMCPSHAHSAALLDCASSPFMDDDVSCLCCHDHLLFQYRARPASVSSRRHPRTSLIGSGDLVKIFHLLTGTTLRPRSHPVPRESKPHGEGRGQLC
jgi:hypothetical protein